MQKDNYIISAYGCGCSWGGVEADHPIKCDVHGKQHVQIIRVPDEQIPHLIEVGLGWDHSTQEETPADAI